MKLESQYLRTTDNHSGKEVNNQFINELGFLANKKISNLVSETETRLLILPADLNEHGDDLGSQSIFELNNNILRTGNILGFIGTRNYQLTISSRFSGNENDYFLHYMLQKVLSINIFDLRHSFDKESIFDFLIYLFPYYLKSALSKGLYKEYHKTEYNNSNLHGTIDIGRHIKSNMPFAGKIAYHTREHSYNNKVTQLIRHTIEFIKRETNAHKILSAEDEVQACVSQIVQATPDYSIRERRNILNKNLKTVSHPWFSEYVNLQKLCIEILKYEQLKYGIEDEEIYGLLFDGAWLWEEYLNTILRDCGFIHPENKTSKGAISLFTSGKYRRYPDFWKDNIILDAKYKRILDNEKESIARDDIHQILSYMYVKKADNGGIIYPVQKGKTKYNYTGKLNGYGGDFFTISFAIPQNNSSYADFCEAIKESELALRKILNREMALSN